MFEFDFNLIKHRNGKTLYACFFNSFFHAQKKLLWNTKLFPLRCLIKIWEVYQIETLENYWTSKLKEKDFYLIEQLLFEIETSELKLDEIARKFKISRQYINKLFLKYIGKSPTDYRKRYRFRNAIRQAKEVKNLRELTFDNLFYDQSHFNKDFKELTQSNPTSFFKNVDTEKENV